jgi:hypothetical protein
MNDNENLSTDKTQQHNTDSQTSKIFVEECTL